MSEAEEMFWAARVDSFPRYLAFLDFMGEEFKRRQAFEHQLSQRGDEFFVEGYCGICGKPTSFKADYLYCFTMPDGSRIPNWRERLECTCGCGLNNRTRAALQFFRDWGGAKSTDRVYVTEQVTPFFKAISGLYPNTTGSEYLSDGTPRGQCNSAGIRCEDFTRLTFQDGSIDHILSFDVIEHIPDYRAALRECARCLRPDGKFIVTAPFNTGLPKNQIRARLTAGGQIEHLLEPEYHGDPINDKGVLCFYHFGWELLDDLRDAGFSDAAVYFYWSMKLGYLGVSQMLIMARK